MKKITVVGSINMGLVAMVRNVSLRISKSPISRKESRMG